MTPSSADALAEADAMLLGAGRAVDLAAGAAAYFKAAADGDPAAMLRSAVFAAEGLGCEQDWSKALALVMQAAELGNQDARRQLLVLADQHHASDWVALARAVDWDALLSAPPLARVTDKAQIGIARGFAPPRFARWLIERAIGDLAPATVHDEETGQLVHSEHRSALIAPFTPLTRDLICAVLEERAARLTRTAITHHEPMNVISYEAGQQYGLHFDFVPPKLLETDPHQASLGQRNFTVVTYLNDAFEGAETHFPRLGIRIKPELGDAIVWSNVRADGEPNPDTLHAGLPPTSGRKWVLSQWIRNRPQPAR